MSRLLLIAVVALALSACGFHLRDGVALPSDLGPVRVVTSDPYSALGESLAQALERAGATPAGKPAKEGVDSASTLNILSERWASTPISVDQYGRAQEFTLRYAVVFALRQGDGRILVPQQAVEMSRDYVAAPTDSIGKASESELLARELRREMTAAILRRIEAASRQQPAVATP